VIATFLPFTSMAVCKRSAFDLPVTIEGTRPVVAAKFNGESVRLLVDSGASFSMISSSVVEQFKLGTSMAPFGLTLRGIGGTTAPSVATVKVFTLGNVDIPNIKFLVSGNEVGTSAGVGLIGQNLLQRWDVEYNLANGMLRLMRDEDCHGTMLAYWVKPGESYTVIDIPKPTPKESLTVGSAYINGVKIRVIFDTGAWLSMLSTRAAERAGVKTDMPGVTDGGFSRGVGRSSVKTYIAPFDSFKFDGGEEIRRTHLRIADIDLDADMLLGADFFLSHRVFVAHSQNKLYFTYNGGPVFNLAVVAQAPTNAPTNALANAPDTKPDDADGKKESDGGLDAAALAGRGTGFAGRRDFDHALADLTRASELEPNNTEYIFLRGRTYAQKGEVEKALADFDRTIQLKPDHVLALMSRAELRLRAKNGDGAREDLDALDKIAAKQANVRFEMALAYERLNLLPAAIAQFDLWIPSRDEDARLATALGGRCRARAILGRDLDMALKDCNGAVSRSVKGSNAPSLATRAFVRLRLGDYDKSIGDYDAALKINPQMPAALYGRGLAKIKRNKITEGEADIANARKIAPKIAEQFEALGITR
jgi:tetratricopeptide (TPR) repeat protein/predicted aspartyl protease